MGKRQVKNRFKVSESEKLDFKVWASEFLPLLDEVAATLSLRQIAVALGQNEGWASRAREHRGLVGRVHLRKLEILAKKLRSESDGITGVGQDSKTGEVLTDAALLARLKERGWHVAYEGPGETGLRAPEKPAPAPPPAPEPPPLPRAPLGEEARRRWFLGVMDELRDEPHNFKWEQVAQVFGYNTGNSACSAYRGGGIPAAWRVERAERILELVRDLRYDEARVAMRAPEPIGKERAKLGQQAHVDVPESRLDRIGPPPRPNRTPPEPQPARDMQAAIATLTKPEPLPAVVVAVAPAANGTPEGLPKLRRLLSEAAEECEREAAKWPSAFRAPWHKLRDELMEKLVGLE